VNGAFDMNSPHDRKQRRRQLALDVRRMRKLGVIHWEGVVLGPEPKPITPPKELTEDELKARAFNEAERKHNTLFAASSVKPKLPGGP
jgi:hypothetical protein